MYIPILKNRTVEMATLKELVDIGINEKVIPLIEIVQENMRSNSQKTYIEDLKSIIDDSHLFMIDYPKFSNTKSTSSSIQSFSSKILRQKNFVINEFKKCSIFSNMIPVVSYEKNSVIDENAINEDITELRSIFSNVSLRLTPSQYSKIQFFSKIKIGEGDFVLIDIDDSVHTNPIFKSTYSSIYTNRDKMKFKSIIVNSNRPYDLTNKGLEHGQPIEKIDNSILEMYSLKSYRFDGFGDYACVTNALPSTGGAISPAGIYYSTVNNYFVGYKGRTGTLSEFPDYIVPEIMNSIYWSEFDAVHKKKCPGCSKINSINQGEISGKNQGMWKGITMGHYIYSVNEIL